MNGQKPENKEQSIANQVKLENLERMSREKGMAELNALIMKNKASKTTPPTKTIKIEPAPKSGKISLEKIKRAVESVFATSEEKKQNGHLGIG